MILPGNGLTAVDNGDQLIGGSLTFLNDLIGVPDDVKTVAQRLAEEGKTPLLFARSKKILGVIAVADVIKMCIRDRSEPMIDGKSGFLYLDKNDMPMVALHWEKYFQHICEKYNKIYKPVSYTHLTLIEMVMIKKNSC